MATDRSINESTPTTDVTRRAAHAASDPTAKAAEQPTPPPKKSLAELRADATRARGDLASTLDAIEKKLNLPHQIKIRVRRVRYGLRTLGEDNPIAVVGIAVTAATVVGTAVWLGVKAVQRR
ncbi:hypothetical protein [Glaciibacter psychrotolerans]|uniref:DUF3618 domain-containing protein n=1 Tax=Glaciibacter psychrotolerans TaxID=670054 RepID=A0A7Z0EFY3_9MICO|nr:hypothetical protein [Leifsonia psychrotolerans]NYJ20919.1 hypothetical protein [Leifsonia psychrotolerans]